MTETVKIEIAKALKKISVNYAINIKHVRVKITLDNDKLVYMILNKINSVEQISLSKLIGFIYAPLAEGKLKTAIKNTIETNNLNTQIANVRLYMVGDIPSAYLYSGGRPIKQISIENLLK